MEVATELTRVDAAAAPEAIANHDAFARLRALYEEADGLKSQQEFVLTCQLEERAKLVDEYVAQIDAAEASWRDLLKRSKLEPDDDGEYHTYGHRTPYDAARYMVQDEPGSTAVIAGEDGALLVLRLSEFDFATHVEEIKYKSGDTSRKYTDEDVAHNMLLKKYEKWGCSELNSRALRIRNKTRHKTDAVIVWYTMGDVYNIAKCIEKVSFHEDDRPDLAPFFERPWVFMPEGIELYNCIPQEDHTVITRGGAKVKLPVLTTAEASEELCGALHLHTLFEGSRGKVLEPRLWGNGFGGSACVGGCDLSIARAACHYRNWIDGSISWAS